MQLDMPFDLLILFFSTSLLLCLIPGPDNLFVLSESLVFGSRSGLLVVLGLCTGLILHTSLVALGLAALLATSEQLLIFIKVMGMSYLLYLAVLSWKDSGQLSASKPRRQLGSWQLYRRGIIMNSTNPKVALFFLAFLPQFVDVSYGTIAVQVMLLGFLFILSTILVFGAIALLAGRYSERLNQSTQNRMILNRSVSVIFVMLALNLLLNII